MADCQYDWSTKTVPKLPTVLITPNMKPLYDIIVRYEPPLFDPAGPWCANDALSHSTTAPGVRPYFESMSSGIVRFTFSGLR